MTLHAFVTSDTAYIKREEQIKFKKCLLPFSSKSSVFPFCCFKIKSKINTTITFSVVLHVCENLSVTLRKADRVRVFKNRMVRNVCVKAQGADEDTWG